MDNAYHPYAQSAHTHGAASAASSSAASTRAPPFAAPAQPLAPPVPVQSTSTFPRRRPARDGDPSHLYSAHLPSTSPAAASSSSSPVLEPAYMMKHGYAAPHRIWAESSPALSPYAPADPSSQPLPPPLHDPARPEPMRRQGSNTVTRRLIVDEHGVEREETREERRARKERERAHRAAATGQDGAYSDYRQRSARTSRTSDGVDVGGGPGSPPLSFASPASVSSPHFASSSSTTNGPTSSKSVLTIALQRAQSAVLLDSANNFPAALTAYTQSVRLLKEVMARVEEGSRDMERKLSEGGRRDGETADEWERRRARYERKERAKSDEARRLRVIHDTYEDRIRMLAQMGHPTPGFAAPSSQALAPGPSSLSSPSISSATPDLSAPSSFATPSTSASPSFAQLSIDDPGGGGAYRLHHAPVHARDRSDASLRIVAAHAPTAADEPDADLAADGIGAAMLLSSPTERAVPALSSLPVALAHDHGAGEGHLAPHGPVGASARPLSIASDVTTTARSRTPDTAMPSLPAPIPLLRPQPSPTDSDGLSMAVEPASSDALSSPAQSLAFESASSSVPARHPALASLEMRRGSSASALSGDTLRAGAMAAGSGGATPMRRGSSLGLLGSADAAPVEIRPRPVRTVSLAGAAPPAAQQRPPLVNASTAEGTISQRRAGARSPVPPEHDGDATAMRPPPEVAVRAPSSEAERAFAFPPPADPPRPPLKSTSSASSLPGRLRALSQPGSKRPKLPSFDASSPPSRPPLPPLLATGLGVGPPPASQRAASASHAASASLSSSSAPLGTAHGTLARKSSAPTPTSLTAPGQGGPLGRSNSASSVASTASCLSTSRAAAGGGAGAPGSPSDTPAASTFAPSFASTQYPGAVGSAGVYLSKGLPSPPQPGAPSSREATLALPSVRRPFHLMRLVAATIPTGEGGASGAPGGYLSERLFVPAHAWTTQAGTKLVAIETKVRMLDLLSSGLDALERAGRGLLLVPVGSSAAAGAAREEAGRFARELESFEGLAEGVQSTLGKKLGGGVIGAAGGGIAGGAGMQGTKDKDAKQGRKGSTASFSAWSSKLSLSLNRVVANGVSLDSQATYVDAIAKVFRQAQILDHHLSLVFPSSSPDSSSSPSPDSAYALLPPQERHRLERHMRKASEFFAHVVCRFVLRDVGVLLDKYVKRGGAWLSGE